MKDWQSSLAVIVKEITHLVETMKKKDEAKEEALKIKADELLANKVETITPAVEEAVIPGVTPAWNSRKLK